MTELRVVWEEREGLRHAVSLHGHLVAGTMRTDTPAVTDCGVALPYLAYMAHEPVNCQACLFGGLDGLLREFSEADVREGVPA